MPWETSCQSSHIVPCQMFNIQWLGLLSQTLLCSMPCIGRLVWHPRPLLDDPTFRLLDPRRGLFSCLAKPIRGPCPPSVLVTNQSPTQMPPPPSSPPSSPLLRPSVTSTNLLRVHRAQAALPPPTQTTAQAPPTPPPRRRQGIRDGF